MKKLYLANILIFLTAVTSSVTADDAMQPTSASSSDPSALTTPVDPNAPIPTDMSLVPRPVPSSSGIDPTLEFFTALSACTPGNYTEKNIISAEIGQPMMNQVIIGPNDDQTFCQARLTTPDNRTLNCEFPMADLPSLNDQHFLQGMLTDTINSPEQNSVTADMKWSQMKVENCSFE